MAIALIALYALPKQSNVMFYSARSASTTDLIESLKRRYYVANGALCIAWILATVVSKGSISELNIEVEELEAEDQEKE